MNMMNQKIVEGTFHGREQVQQIPPGTFHGGEQVQQIPPGTFHGGEQVQQIPPGTFHGGEQVQQIPPGTFHATRMGSAKKTSIYTEPVRCMGYQCGKVFYIEYSNGFWWKCPYCGKEH